MHSVAPSTSMYVPAGQLEQLSLPVTLAKRPAPHTVHKAEPSSSEYLPASQLEHDEARLSEAVPVGHNEQFIARPSL